MRLTGLALSAAIALSGCVSSPDADALLALPSDVQIQALQECQAEQGVAVPAAAIQVIELRNGGASVFVANGPGVSLGLARALNRCSTEKLRDRLGASGASPSVGGSTASVPSTAVVGAGSGRAVAPAPAVAFGCVEGLGTMQRGTLICPGF